MYFTLLSRSLKVNQWSSGRSLWSDSKIPQLFCPLSSPQNGYCKQEKWQENPLLLGRRRTIVSIRVLPRNRTHRRHTDTAIDTIGSVSRESPDWGFIYIPARQEELMKLHMKFKGRLLENFLLIGEAHLLFYSGLQLIGWGPTHIREGNLLYTKSPKLNVNLIQSTLTETQNDVWVKNIWVSHGPVQLLINLTIRTTCSERMSLGENTFCRVFSADFSLEAETATSAWATWGIIK